MALIVEGLRTGCTIAAADGSFKDQRGTSGYALVHASTGQRINGANQVPGEETDQASYQSELTGIYGTLPITQMLCKIHGIDDGHLVVACDNLLAGQKAIEWEYPPKPANDHFDMLAAIPSLPKVLPITTEFRNVEAHQQEKYSTQALDQWAIWNDEMDALAKAYWAFIIDAAAPTSAAVQGYEWSVWVNGGKVCKNSATQFAKQFIRIG
jgi:ribonuclease HI